jgi:hypothetical protein
MRHEDDPYDLWLAGKPDPVLKRLKRWIMTLVMLIFTVAAILFISWAWPYP